MHFGFSEFSHHTPEIAHEVNEKRTIANLHEFIRKQQEIISDENLAIRIRELNQQQINELNQINKRINSLKSEISSLQEKEMTLYLTSRYEGIKLPKRKAFDEIKEISASEIRKGSLEDAREELRLLTIKRNNLQATVSDYRHAIDSHYAVQNEVAFRNIQKHKIDLARKKEGLKISEQLHPSKKSAKVSAQVFVTAEEAASRNAKEQQITLAQELQNIKIAQQLNPSRKSAKESANVFIEIDKEAVLRSAKKRQIDNAQFLQDVKIQHQLKPSGKSAKESAQVFIREEAIARNAKERQIIQAQNIQDLKIVQQLNPSGKSAKESADVFINHFNNIEEAAERNAKKRQISNAQYIQDLKIERQLNPSGKSAKESADVFINESKGIKNTLKNGFNSFINTVKTHKKAAILIALATTVLTGIAIYTKNSKKQEKKPVENITTPQFNSEIPSCFDEFKKI